MSAFVWMILLPLVATPAVYLAGRATKPRGVIARRAALPVLAAKCSALWLKGGLQCPV